MKEKQFLKTASRVREILQGDEYSREDDFYLTWKYWKSIDPLLEELTMKEFKTLFLSGYYGLPATVTRSRALIQNKTNPELRAKYSDGERTKRGEILQAFFRSADPLQEINEDLQVIRDHVTGEEIMEKVRETVVKYKIPFSLEGSRLKEAIDIRTKSDPSEYVKICGINCPRGSAVGCLTCPDLPAPTEADLRFLDKKEIEIDSDWNPLQGDNETLKKKTDKYKRKFEEMKNKKSGHYAGEKYYSVGEYLSLFRRGQSIDIATRDLIIKSASRISQEFGIPEKIKPGSGLREGLRVLVFKQSILEKLFNEIINPLT